MEATTLVTGLCMGLALAATCGLRAFLPLFVVSLLSHLGHIELSDGFEWMSSTSAVAGLGAAVLLELLADKIPVVDHVLDTVAVVVKPLAAMVAAASVMTELDPMLSTVVGLVLGGTMAQGVHLVKAKLRLLSSALTATVANPFVSIIEDILALMATILAFLLPVLLFVAALLVSLWGFRAWIGRRKQASEVE